MLVQDGIGALRAHGRQQVQAHGQAAPVVERADVAEDELAEDVGIGHKALAHETQPLGGLFLVIGDTG